MKAIYFFSSMLCLILHTNLSAQNPGSTGNLPSSTEVHTDEIVLQQFRYTDFVADVTVAFREKGYDFETDKCLKDFFVTYQMNLFKEVFDAYGKTHYKTVFKTIYTSQLITYRAGLKEFMNQEPALRKEWDRRIASAQATH